jgi:hypothetical protein
MRSGSGPRDVGQAGVRRRFGSRESGLSLADGGGRGSAVNVGERQVVEMDSDMGEQMAGERIMLAPVDTLGGKEGHGRNGGLWMSEYAAPDGRAVD